MGIVTTCQRAFNTARLDLEEVDGALRVPSHAGRRGNNRPGVVDASEPY